MVAGVKKINASGRPIRKTTGRLENLRIVNEPEPGMVQLNFPVPKEDTEEEQEEK